MSSYFTGNCKGCGPCGGKWNAAAARVNWYGFEGNLSTVTCGGACDYTRKRYLQKTVNIRSSWVNSATQWVWVDGAWTIQNYVDGSTPGNFVGTNQWTWTIDPHKGDGPITGCTQSIVKSGDQNSNTCDGSVVGLEGVLDGIDYTGQILYDLEQFGWKCGAFGPIAHGSHIYFAGGDAAAFVAWVTQGLADSTCSVDAVTDTHVGFQAAAHHHYANLTEPPPGPADPVCRTVDIDITLDVSIDLSSPYTYDDLYNDAVALLAYYPLLTTPWHSRDDALLACTSVNYLRYNDTNAGGLGSPGLCGHVPDPAFDGRILGKPDVDPMLVDFLVPWGAEHTFTPTTGALDDFYCGSITLVKWCMRQGAFQPFGAEDGAAKTWNYLLQRWTFQSCTSVATYQCDDETGGKDFIMVISPNSSDSPTLGKLWRFADIGGGSDHGGERKQGDIWQAVCRDSGRNRYVGGESPCSPIDLGGTPVEPQCSCDCPTTAEPTCQAPIPGECPCTTGELCVEEDNWP